MTKYQLGSASIDGEETSVVKLPQGLFRLSTVLVAGAGTAPANPSLFEVFSLWDHWHPKLSAAVQGFVKVSGSAIPLDEASVRWLAPIRYPRALICMGENYADHIAEMPGFSELKMPYSFLKPPHTTLCASGQDVPLLACAKMNDWEAELAVVIGRTVRNVEGDDIMGCVAGYSIINDLSARDWVKDKPSLGLDWVMQKASDGYGPMGPYITPAEFVPNCQDLNISLTLNGKTMQDSNTSKMLFTVSEVVRHVSMFMTLSAGDIIATGTPAGTGFGRKPQLFLKPGDVTCVTIEGLGTLENRFV